MSTERKIEEPVLITNRHVNDVFYDDIKIELMASGLCRIHLIRDRVTTDGIAYREPVINLICLTSKVAMQATMVATVIGAGVHETVVMH